jgi:hypothetical protein
MAVLLSSFIENASSEFFLHGYRYEANILYTDLSWQVTYKVLISSRLNDFFSDLWPFYLLKMAVLWCFFCMLSYMKLLLHIDLWTVTYQDYIKFCLSDFFSGLWQFNLIY